MALIGDCWLVRTLEFRREALTERDCPAAGYEAQFLPHVNHLNWMQTNTNSG